MESKLFKFDEFNDVFFIQMPKGAHDVAIHNFADNNGLMPGEEARFLFNVYYRNKNEKPTPTNVGKTLLQSFDRNRTHRASGFGFLQQQEILSQFTINGLNLPLAEWNHPYDETYVVMMKHTFELKLLEEILEKKAANYAEEQNDCYTNDFDGFQNGGRFVAEYLKGKFDFDVTFISEDNSIKILSGDKCIADVKLYTKEGIEFFEEIRNRIN